MWVNKAKYHEHDKKHKYQHKCHPKRKDLAREQLRFGEIVNVVEVWDLKDDNHKFNICRIEGRGWTCFKWGPKDAKSGLEH